jgi:tetratricopeptide (TPR) repeat protein
VWIRISAIIDLSDHTPKPPIASTSAQSSLPDDFHKDAPDKKVKLSTTDLAKIDQQIAAYSAAIKANPQDKTALYGRAELYSQKYYYDDAVNDYSTLIMQDNKDIKAYFYRAIAQTKRGNIDQALADYKQVIALDPKNYLAYNNRGLLYLDKQDFDKSVDDFNKSLTINPQYAQAYYNRSMVFSYTKDFSNAQKDLIQALSLHDQSDMAFEIKILYRLAIAFYNQGNYPDALTQLNAVIKLAPNSPKLYTLRALVYDQLGNNQQAFADRTKAQELSLSNML